MRGAATTLGGLVSRQPRHVTSTALTWHAQARLAEDGTLAGQQADFGVSIPAPSADRLTLCPQLCMGIQHVARFPAWSADALLVALYGHFIQAIYRNRPTTPHTHTTPTDESTRWHVSVLVPPRHNEFGVSAAVAAARSEQGPVK